MLRRELDLLVVESGQTVTCEIEELHIWGCINQGTRFVSADSLIGSVEFGGIHSGERQVAHHQCPMHWNATSCTIH